MLEEHIAWRAGWLAGHKQRGMRLSLPCSFLTNNISSWLKAWLGSLAALPKPQGYPQACLSLPAPGLPPPSWQPRTPCQPQPGPRAPAPVMLQKGWSPAPHSPDQVPGARLKSSLFSGPEVQSLHKPLPTSQNFLPVLFLYQAQEG